MGREVLFPSLAYIQLNPQSMGRDPPKIEPSGTWMEWVSYLSLPDLGEKI